MNGIKVKLFRNVKSNKICLLWMIKTWFPIRWSMSAGAIDWLPHVPLGG